LWECFARRVDATRNQIALKIAYINLVIIRINVDNSWASYEKRRSKFINNILSEVLRV